MSFHSTEELGSPLLKQAGPCQKEAKTRSENYYRAMKFLISAQAIFEISQSSLTSGNISPLAE